MHFLLTLTPKDENRLTRRLENVYHHKQFAPLCPNFPFWKCGIWCRQNRSRIAYNRDFVFLKRWEFCRLTLWWFFLVIWKTCHSNAPFLKKHSVWKLPKMSHSTLRAKRAMFTFWVDKSSTKMPKMVHFGEFLKTWSSQSHSVTRQANFKKDKNW